MPLEAAHFSDIVLPLHGSFYQRLLLSLTERSAQNNKRANMFCLNFKPSMLPFLLIKKKKETNLKKNKRTNKEKTPQKNKLTKPNKKRLHQNKIIIKKARNQTKKKSKQNRNHQQNSPKLLMEEEEVLFNLYLLI